jgi:SAM-dependent methyltransferase
MSQNKVPNKAWYLQYHDVKNSRNWRSWPLIRHARGAGLRRLKPFGAGRHGELSVIRYYWAHFLEQQRADFRGSALEVGETATIRYYGGGNLSKADALDLTAHSPEVQVVADLARADHLPGAQYDCFLLQFTNNVVFDIASALYHALRLLRPGGVLLTNFWCTDFYFHNGLDMGTGAPLYMHWFFTPIQVENLLCGLGLAGEDYTLRIYGNLLTKTAFLMNLPARELTAHERDTCDPGQPLLICARVVKPDDWQCARPAGQDPHWLPAAAPLRAQPDTGHYGDAYLR